MPERFPAEVAALLDRTREVEIETAAHPAAVRHRTVIWVVVDEAGRVLIRSVRGARGRWFREAVANPEVALHVDGQRIPATAVLAADEERIASASRELATKYGGGPSTEAMLVDDVLATTLELVPAG